MENPIELQKDEDDNNFRLVMFIAVRKSSKALTLHLLM
jgi:hypothetical protein